MPLCLVLPGLLWPRKAHADSTYDLDLPSLSWLLGHGRSAWDESMPLESLLCRSFGIDADEAPAAALRLLGGGVHPGADFWLCADLAHLGVERNNVALSETAPADLAPADVAELAVPLAEHLAPLGELRLDDRGHGHLRLAKAPALRTTPPSAAFGRRADTVEPQGPDARAWRHIANDVQMLLHRHPVNLRREAAGRKAINTLWFWGGGTLPLQRPSPFAAAWSRGAADALLQGLAAWGEISWRAAPDGAADLLADRHADGLLLLESLLPGSRAFDALGWREALSQLDRNWFAPLQAALRSGRLDRLSLVALGDEARCVVTVSPTDRLRFWRSPQPLAALLPPDPP